VSAKQDGEAGAASKLRDTAGEGSSTQTVATRSAEGEPDHLTLVAECLERGDRAGAATHLEAYVRQHPEQLMFRLQLAELLAQLGRDAHAKPHYEHFALDARHANAAVKNHLVHVHTQLMEIGLRQGDRFAEVFHRGVGLLLLAVEEDGDAALREEMLCKALKSLVEAKELKPGDARVRLHLAEAYDRTGNRRGAEIERAAARSGVVPDGVGLVLPR
jgi:Flp pilus assembly protein TadD